MKVLSISKELKSRLQDEDMANLIGAGEAKKSQIIVEEKMLAIDDKVELVTCCRKSCK